MVHGPPSEGERPPIGRQLPYIQPVPACSMRALMSLGVTLMETNYGASWVHEGNVAYFSPLSVFCWQQCRTVPMLGRAVALKAQRQEQNCSYPTILSIPDHQWCSFTSSCLRPGHVMVAYALAHLTLAMDNSDNPRLLWVAVLCWDDEQRATNAFVGMHLAHPAYEKKLLKVRLLHDNQIGQSPRGAS